MPIATTPPHPHLPVPLGQLSVWQQSTRDHPLLDAGKDDELPEGADVVIVGSGMCGAVIAHTLLNSPDRPANIVVLEAREICSGASGRNAGHCRPDAARGFTAFSGMHGAEEAKHILSSETDVFKRVDAFVKNNKIDCEWTPRTTYDACLSEEFKAYESEALAGLRAAGGEPEGFAELDAVQANEASLFCYSPFVTDETRLDSTVGAFSWRAGTLNPAQLTLSIHTQNVAKGGYKLYSHAPVIRVDEAAKGGENRWSVVTSRGTVKAAKVVFATNAYSQAVVPELEGLVVPWRAQAIKLPAAPAGEELFPRLGPSYSLRYLVHHFYSVAPRPDGSIILGTSRQYPSMPPSLRHTSINTVDDSAPVDAITANALATWGRLFPAGGWDTELDHKGQPGAHEYAWTGIIGMTPDAVPFVGEVPGKEGQYVAAGYNGHGMARIFLCAPALAQYMLTGEWDPAMPKSFRVTPERLDRLREKVGLAKAAGREDDATAEGMAKMIG